MGGKSSKHKHNQQQNRQFGTGTGMGVNDTPRGPPAQPIYAQQSQTSTAIKDKYQTLEGTSQFYSF